MISQTDIWRVSGYTDAAQLYDKLQYSNGLQEAFIDYSLALYSRHVPPMKSKMFKNK